MPSVITEIGDNAFANCTSLAGITVPGTVSLAVINRVGFINCQTRQTSAKCQGSASYSYYALGDRKTCEPARAPLLRK